MSSERKGKGRYLWIVLTVPILALIGSFAASNTFANPSESPGKSEQKIALPASLVISQIYGGGGSSSAPWQNDFVEIFNPTSSPITMNGWSMQYAAAMGIFTSTQTTVLNGTIPAGGYFLIQEAAGTGCSGLPCGSPLPAPDATGNINLVQASGKIALVSSINILSGPCPVDPSIVDFVGYGSLANCYEGSGQAPPTGQYFKYHSAGRRVRRHK